MRLRIAEAKGVFASFHLEEFKNYSATGGYRKKAETIFAEVYEEINELDRATIKTVNSLKHIDDYLKHHGPKYAPNIVNWDELKLGFAEEDDYIEQRKPRSKPTGKNDPYLDKNKDPDYPKKEGDNIITY